jgi:TonB-dependent receptor
MKHVATPPAACIPRNVFSCRRGLLIAAILLPAYGLAQQAAPVTPVNSAEADEKVVKLDEYVVEGSLMGRARAQEIQKEATNLVNVVSADKMGTFPDINAAEALARLPGINIVRSDGEGRFVTIRGAKPNFNGVLMNGFTSPSGDRDERRVDLQTVPNALIERIEVTKAATPDIPAEGIGGVTNILFRNPAELREREGTISVDYGWQEYGGSDKNGSFYYADHVGSDKKLGFVISGAMREAPRPTYSIQSGGWGQTPQGVWRPTSFSLQWDDLVRERKGYDLAVGYKLSEQTKFEVRGFYSHFGEPEYQHRLTLGSINPLLSGTTPVEFAASGGLVTASVNRNAYYQYWNQSLTGGTFKASHEFANGTKVDVGLARQTNREYYPFDRGYLAANTAVTNGIFRYTLRDTFVAVNPVNAEAQAAYKGSFHRIAQFDDARDRMDVEVEEVLYGNVAHQFRLANESSLELKAGFYGRFRDKDIDRARGVLTQVAGSNITFASVLNGGFESDFAGKNIVFGDYMNNETFYNTLNLNPTVFALPVGPTEQLGFGIGDYVGAEDMTAFYGQGTYKLGKLTVLGGVRFETTKVKLKRLNNETNLVTLGDDYNHVMPSIHFRYDITDDIIARASWSNTVGRHDYGDRIFGGVTVNRAAATITIPNVGLKPLESENFDVSVDWYSGPLGLMSVGYFTKDIVNFPLATSRAITFEGLPFTELTVQSGVTGKIHGWEATFNRRFDFLPAPFNGLGIDFNYADIDSEIGTPTRPDRPRIDQQPEWVMNTSLYFAWKNLFVRLAQSGRSALINRNGTNATNPALDIYQAEYLQYDLTFSYDFTRRFQLYGEWRNITSENEEFYQGEQSRPTETKFNGYTYTAGVRYRF